MSWRILTHDIQLNKFQILQQQSLKVKPSEPLELGGFLSVFFGLCVCVGGGCGGCYLFDAEQ